ncbi:MAG TPA: D-glucuronyl C5-epimerase family protein, partial [Solirubrobacteraceae bacterium]|nr:D-glucuronyl C5-epimerase family protein [Solirubrobacteraceae bacterium]
MRRTSVVGIVWMLALALSPTASASPLTTLRHDGVAVTREDPYLPATSDLPRVRAPRVRTPRVRTPRVRTLRVPTPRPRTPRLRTRTPGARAPRAPTSAARAPSLRAGAARAPRRTVRSELDRMLAAAAIDRTTYDARLATYADARRLLRKLRGARRAALGAVLANLDAIAARGALNASRLPELFETVSRNREWWARGPLLSYGRRVSFQGSPLVWQYYTGEGLQIQWLGTFGRANALWRSGTHDEDLRTLLDAALALAAQRAGGIAFEYLFDFDGGRPPWVSGLAQGTAVQALSRAAVRLNEPRYFAAARTALGVFRQPPPSGVRAGTAIGAHYLLYSFAPGLRVLNAFTQAVNGLHDFALLANDVEGRALFAAGEAELRAELPAYDTGAWSRYSLRREADLSYHKLARDFLGNLCTRLTEAQQRTPVAPAAAPTGGVVPVPGAPPAVPAPATPAADPAPYCGAAQRWTQYLRQAPKIALVSTRVRGGRPGAVRFTL